MLMLWARKQFLLKCWWCSIIRGKVSDESNSHDLFGDF